jgi:ribosomal protein S18 acetylase RimI-like enzyme
MNDYGFRKATAEDAGKLNLALQALSKDLGDEHLASAEDLVRHGLGSEICALHAMLAERPDGSLAGAALYSPLFSTVRGSAGLYVSDLWVAENTRGSGLGRQLLAAVSRSMPANWTIGFIRLAVYNSNPSARRFYDRLGFDYDPEETFLTLTGTALDALQKTR